VRKNRKHETPMASDMTPGYSVTSSLGSGWPAHSGCPPAAPIEGWMVAVLGATLLLRILKVVGIYK
jgi:hypothetical protein